MGKITETAIAKVVMDWHVNDGWDVYPEVVINYRGSKHRADLVCVRNNLSRIIETKTSLGLPVLAQANHWLHVANQVYICTPFSTHNSSFMFAKKVCQALGIGYIEISCDNKTYFTVHSPISRTKFPLKNFLSACHQNYVPGNSDSSYHTQYKNTCQQLLRLATKEPGILLKTAIESIHHHYTNDNVARQSIAHWAKVSGIPGLVVRKVGNRLRLYPLGED